MMGAVSLPTFAFLVEPLGVAVFDSLEALLQLQMTFATRVP